ncbi:MAG: TIGR02391 family protein [Thermoleophilia bacterium]
MDWEAGLERLQARLEELGRIGCAAESSFEIWRHKTDRTLGAVMGEHHHLVQEFRKIQYGSAMDPDTAGVAFANGQRRATGVLEAAIYEKEELDSYELLQASFVDPELWEHVKHLVEQEQWGQVASQTAIFVESMVRECAGLPAGEVGKTLMTAVFSPEKGEFPLGRTEGERQGWHMLGMGFSMALGNVDRHHIQDRLDLKRYAFGVLGAGSLLLTQLRYQFGDQFDGTASRNDS